ncbi:MAG TPA: HEPN domain-containing protein [Phycisphaerae bacterium]|nr:HEPN domain-containing protein [Phycisphaerae bacterium]
MKDLTDALWARAKDALRTAGHDLPVSPDAAVSRAYYAAFYAVSAMFSLRGRTFRKHSAVEAAVHRDLVKAGLWPEELGEGYSALVALRHTGDYGDLDRVSSGEAHRAVALATEILRAVAKSDPDAFGGLGEA